MDPLGVLVSTHPVNNRRRWIIAAQAAVVAVVATAFLTALVAHPIWSKAVGKLVGLLLLGLVVGFPTAAVQLAKAVRGGFASFDIDPVARLAE